MFSKPPTMLLKRNLAANAVTQVWAFVLNIVALPLYLAALGPEPYALIGFGLTIQIWTTLLDAGMSPTLSRDMARYRSGALPEHDVLSFLRSLDWICVVLIVAVSLIGFLSRDWWAGGWFQSQNISNRVIGQVMALVIIFCMLRWAAGLYRSALMGLERQVLANGIITGATTIRLLGAVPVAWVTQDVRIVFLIWVATALVELALFRIVVGQAFKQRLPLFHFSLESLRGRARLAGSIAFLSVVSILVTQLDKLVLARVLPLADYGYFTLAVVLSNAMLMLPVPIVQAIQPRLTAAVAAGNKAELRRLFHMATQLVSVVTLAPAVVLAALPRTAIYTWTGDAVAAEMVQPYLGLYILGSSLVGIGGMLYLVQLAYGNVRLHVIANVIFGVILIPSVVYVAANHGPRGAALLWLVLNLASLLLYCPVAIRRFLPGAGAQWFTVDIALPGIAVAALAVLARLVFGDATGNYLADLALLIATGASALTAGTLATPVARAWVAARLRSVSREAYR